MDIRDQIIKDNMPMIEAIVRVYATDVDEGAYNDMLSGALLGATYALDNYVPEKGNFTAFLRLCVRSGIIGELRKIYRWNIETPFSFVDNCTDSDRQYDPSTGGYHDGISAEDKLIMSPWHDEEPINPEEELLRKEDINIAKQIVIDLAQRLNDREQFVLFNNIINSEPMSVRDMAKHFSCTKSSIHRTVQKVKLLIEVERN